MNKDTKGEGLMIFSWRLFHSSVLYTPFHSVKEKVKPGEEEKYRREYEELSLIINSKFLIPHSFHLANPPISLVFAQ